MSGLIVTCTQGPGTVPRPPLARYRPGMTNRLADTLNSWQAQEIGAVAVAFAGVMVLVTRPDGFDVTLGVCLLLLAALNAGRAVQAYRRRASR